MTGYKKAATTGAIIIVAAAALFASSCTEVKSDQIGVRVNNVPFMNKVEEKPKLTGYHFFLPRLFNFYKLPQTHMTIDMVETGKIEFKRPGEPIEAAKIVPESGVEQVPQKAEDQLDMVKQELSQVDRVQIVVHDRRTGKQSVRVKTADGNDAWVDVTVAFQIIPEKAYLTVMKIGTTEDEIKPVVEAMVRGTIRSWLGELDSKAILRATDRREQVEGKYEYDPSGNPAKKLADGAIDDLNEDLEKFGIMIVKLSAPTVAIHPDYEEVLSKKRIAEEEKEEYLAYQQKAVEEKETKINKARGEADSMIELAGGRYQRIRQEADAQYEARRLKSEAAKEKVDQMADGIEAMTAQLAAPGGEAHVGLAVSEALQGKKIIIVPGTGAVNMLDVNELIQTWGAVQKAKGNPGEEKEQGQ